MMSFLNSFIRYLQQDYAMIFKLFLEHLQLTFISVFFSILIGVPLGILISYVKKLSQPVLGFSNLVQAIPSMAILGFLIPLLGIGRVPAIVTVVLYSLLPIIKNTYTGINSVDPDILESARGIGLTKLQILFKVELPLSLPIIMAGVRISAVTAVGLITIAALIGAGGLGYLVYSGISSVNTNLILAGAIPASMLALFIDYLFGLIEKLVTPFSLQKSFNQSRSSIKKQRRSNQIKLFIAVTLIGSLFLFQTTAPSKKGDKIVIGGKEYTEQLVLTHLVASLIENKTDLVVVRKPSLGGTQVNFTAMNAGAIDLYVEYTGTIIADMLKMASIKDVDEAYNVSKQELYDRYNLMVLGRSSFNNQYVLALRQDTINEYGLKTISDLIPIADRLSIGAHFEFLNREDGLLGLTKAYGFTFKKSLALNGGQRYLALVNHEIDVTDAFSTDSLIKKFDLVTLEDDRNFFSSYYAVPLVREQMLKDHPEIQQVLDPLMAYLTNEIMLELNYQVDELQRNPRLVADTFLKEHGFID